MGTPVALPTRAQIEALQALISSDPQVELKTEHFFTDGMYLRTLFRPKGTLIVGKVHRRDHFYVVVFGDVTVTSDGERERVRGPKVFICKPGTKRAVFAHEDSLCLTVHRTDETDLERVEADLVEEDLSSMYLPGNTLKVLA